MTRLIGLLTLVLLVSCSAEGVVSPMGRDEATPDETAAAEAELRTHEADVVLARGVGTRLLGITKDDHAIFQQSGHIKELDLRRPKAQAITIAEAGKDTFAFAYISGVVAFIWTSPDYSSPSYGVSPLVIWSAESGAHRASENSPVGTLTTVASRDGREVMFPANARNGGITGDIIWATTDLKRQETLVASVQTDYSNGPCRPLAQFGHETKAIAYCEGANTTSTLSVFREDHRRDLTGLVNPPALQVDQKRGLVTTVRAGSSGTYGTPLLVTPCDVVELNQSTNSLNGYFSSDGSVLLIDIDPVLGSAAVRRAVVHGKHVELSDVATVNALYAPGLFGSDGLSYSLSSPDARWFPFGVTVDPATGTADIQLADLKDPSHPAFTLDAATDNYVISGKFFTSNSRNLLYAKYDKTTGLTSLFVGDARSRQTHALTGPINIATEFQVLGGAAIAYVENAQGTPPDPNTYTADIKTVGLAEGATPNTVALSAWYNVLPALHEAALVYATDQGAAPGLHLARVNR